MSSVPVLILASASPRRRQLLVALGLPFRVDAVDIDEGQLPGESPLAYVLRLARAKAQAAARKHPHAIILAADTIVVHRGEVLGKPSSSEEARTMLRRLRGASHHVMTAVAVAHEGDLHTGLELSRVVMRSYSDKEINAYVDSGEPMDKAGAYAIQDPRFRPVARWEGCFASIMGLPLGVAADLLRRVGLEPEPYWSQRCAVITGHNCRCHLGRREGPLVDGE